MQQADEVRAHVRGARRRRLLEKDQLLGRARAEAAMFGGPVCSRIARVVQAPLPVGVEPAPGGPVVTVRSGRKRRQRLGEPGPKPLAERELGGAKAQVHEKNVPLCLSTVGRH